MNVAESFLKFSQEIINNGENCGWLKQMRWLMKNMIPTNDGLTLTLVMHLQMIRF